MNQAVWRQAPRHYSMIKCPSLLSGDRSGLLEHVRVRAVHIYLSLGEECITFDSRHLSCASIM